MVDVLVLWKVVEKVGEKAVVKVDSSVALSAGSLGVIGAAKRAGSLVALWVVSRVVWSVDPKVVYWVDDLVVLLVVMLDKQCRLF